MSDTDFLEELAASSPTPGGGSAAAYAGAMGAALVEMVARLTTGKKKYAEVEPRMVEIADRAAFLRKQLSEAVAKDAAAFEGVIQAFRMSKENEEEEKDREAAIQEATLIAAEIPLQVASIALEVLQLAGEVAQHGNLNAASDAGAAGAMASASIHAALMNVQINALALDDGNKANSLIQEVEQIKELASHAHHRVSESLKERASIQV